ncbi:AMP-binding protein [Nocardioides sp. Bht2]|uniref:AMP-binding protein n=1 Tax=Nocardioides sp. Bht2 TaxID=3392297 RepID=UPI0039B4D415
MSASSPAALSPARGPLGDLARFGDAPALVTATTRLSHRELADATAAFAARLGYERRLVLLAGRNDVSSLVAYLGTLGAGHVPLLCDARHLDRLIELYRPDTVVRDGVIESHRPSAQHQLHPDLALLLSTSGSTGSPKLVRLSRRNLISNAAAIADYLQLRPTDRAVTTLPPHYCYGLSVIHSHLAIGASLVLTEHSVVDDAFWTLAEQQQITSFAGVPYTFDLLDRVGFPERAPTSLRHVTQAGGRLRPERVAELAGLATARGFDFVVMYGATEATARMAWLPPEQAANAPDAIGLPIPGGSFRLEPIPGENAELGELVYSGPNVMLGYAESPADLARGAELNELRTGDVARIGADGLVRIVGRRSRFAKIYGLRIDLDEAERALEAAGLPARCADGGETLIVALTGPLTSEHRRTVLATALQQWGLPAGAVRLVEVDAFPRLANDKVDYRALVSLAQAPPPTASTPETTATPQVRIERAFAEILGRPVGARDTFLELGGDSLSYVEASVRLEQIIGELPPKWHTLEIQTLAAAASTRPRRGRVLETSVVLRAVAIFAIVSSHANLLTLLGGAHLLLGISGYNYIRFQPHGETRERVRAHLSSAARIAVPAMLWIGAVTLATGTYPWRSVFLVNGLISRGWSEPAWHFWFIEVLVLQLLVLAALTCLPAWRRAEARWPFWLPFAIACGALVTRYELWEPRGGDDIHRTHMVLWIFALGCAIARAEHRWQRIAVSVLTVAALPGFFENTARELFVALGLLLLIWVHSIRLPNVVAVAVTTLASASMYIYLTHWQVYPWLEDRVPALAVLTSFAVGITAAAVARRLGLRLRALSASALSRGRQRGPAAPVESRVPSQP